MKHMADKNLDLPPLPPPLASAMGQSPCGATGGSSSTACKGGMAACFLVCGSALMTRWSSANEIFDGPDEQQRWRIAVEVGRWPWRDNDNRIWPDWP
jgi:hypothetical protein